MSPSTSLSNDFCLMAGQLNNSRKGCNPGLPPNNSNANWTTRGYANSRIANSRTGQLAVSQMLPKRKTKHAKSPMASASCPVTVQTDSRLTSAWCSLLTAQSCCSPVSIHVTARHETAADGRAGDIDGNLHHHRRSNNARSGVGLRDSQAIAD